ncbi:MULTISPECIES: hypothetical protein [unclassified Methylobacterium]|uniref:hypothetical protein n=1 Tax=unclassified Methylobacterium TaxID=2615210 RepID=UPI00164FF94B|nr:MULTISPECIES: hypothetical protein [unclassified Methylobacterium]
MSETEREFMARMRAPALKLVAPAPRDVTRFQRIESEKRWDRVFKKMADQPPVGTP